MNEAAVLYGVAASSDIVSTTITVLHSNLEIPDLKSIQDAIFRKHSPILTRYNKGSFQESANQIDKKICLENTSTYHANYPTVCQLCTHRCRTFNSYVTQATNPVATTPVGADEVEDFSPFPGDNAGN